MGDLGPGPGPGGGVTAPRRFIDRPPESYSGAGWALRLVVRNLQWSRTQGVRRLLEEHEANPARRAAQAARRAYWRSRHGVERGTAVPVLLVGVPRSGTNMLARALKASPEFEVHNDGDAPAFHRYRLRSDEVVADLVGRSRHRFVLFKPTLDSHRTLGLLEHLGSAAPARALWAYRDMDGRVRSAVEKFGPGAAIGMSSVAAGTGSHLWLAQGLSAESLEDLRSVDWSRATTADGAAMVWLVRNRMFFEMGLDARDDVLLVRYGTTVRHPQETVGAVCDFLGARHDRAMSAGIEVRTRRDPPPLPIDPRIRAWCTELAQRFDAAAPGDLPGS